MFRVRARYRLSRRRVRHISVLLRKDISEVLRYLLRGSVAAVGAVLVAAIGLAVMYGPSFVWGYLLICVSSVWGIAAWILSEEVRKHKPTPLRSKKPEKIQKYRSALSSYRRWQFIVPILICLFPIGFMIGHLRSQKLVAPTAQAPITPVPLYLDCQMYGFTLTVPPHTTAYVMPLHPKLKPAPPIPRGFPLNMSFEEILNGGESDLIWPSSQQAPPVPGPSPPGHPGSQIEKCDVRNASGLNIESASIDFPITMSRNTNPGTPQYKYDRQITMIPVSPNQPFTFYMINECPRMFARIEIPKTVTVKISGENGARDVDLLRPQRGSMGFRPRTGSNRHFPGMEAFCGQAAMRVS